MSNIEKNEVVHGVSLAGERDIHLFREGSHDRLYQFLGAHLIEHKGVSGVLFAVWAPDADKVSVIGDFNSWNP